MTRVLVAAGDAHWKSACTDAVQGAAGLSLARDCPDVTELIAASVAGLGDLALVDGSLAGLDADAVATLRRAGVPVLAVAASPDARDWLIRLGAAGAIAPLADAAAWVDAIVSARGGEAEPAAAARGECLVVVGPHGGPGRTTVAIALAQAAAESGRSAVLLDLDPDGGSVAQHLGLVEGQSALPAAISAAHEGTLGPERLDELGTQVRPGLLVLTGLPRPDRWPELRRGLLEALIETARAAAAVVVVDAGSDLDRAGEQWSGAGPARNTATLSALDAADHLVLVGSADAVGFGRSLRQLTTLTEELPGVPVDMVVNRFRESLGWTADELTDLVQAVAPGVGVRLVPDDVLAADAAMLAGRSPWEDSGTRLGARLREVCAAVLGSDQAARLAGAGEA